MTRHISFTFPVTVTIDWPEGVPYNDDKAEDAATSMIHQSDEVDVGPVGRVVWCKRFAEVDTSEVEKGDVIDV